MMYKKCNALIVENESLILYSLKNAFKLVSDKKALSVNIKKVHVLEDVIPEINKSIRTVPFDVVMLDINVTSSKLRKLVFVEDIVKHLRNVSPNTKVILLTSRCTNFKINNILENINPDCFLIKSDIDFKELLLAIEKTMDGVPYYSNNIIRQMRRRFHNNISLDKFDKQILYYLSKGAKTKDLPGIISLSKSAIERRKRILKERLDIEQGGDSLLLKTAKDKGVI